MTANDLPAADIQARERTYQKYAWVIPFVGAVLLVLNALFLISASGPEMFKTDTGVEWAEFSTTYPSIATAYRFEQSLGLVGLLGVALFALVVAYFAFRNGKRWAWYGMWIFPGVLAATAGLMVIAGASGLAIFYAGFTLFVILGILLAFRTFFPSKPEIAGRTGT
jgi:hypothetical protein